MKTIKAHNLYGQLQEIMIHDDDTVSKVICPRCGNRYVWNTSMDGNTLICPICDHVYSEYYDEAKEIKNIERTIDKLIMDLSFNHSLLKTVKGINNIRNRNLLINEEAGK